jgi:hypothetical protein
VIKLTVNVELRPEVNNLEDSDSRTKPWVTTILKSFTLLIKTDLYNTPQTKSTGNHGPKVGCTRCRDIKFLSAGWWTRRLKREAASICIFIPHARHCTLLIDASRLLVAIRQALSKVQCMNARVS